MQPAGSWFSNQGLNSDSTVRAESPKHWAAGNSYHSVSWRYLKPLIFFTEPEKGEWRPCLAGEVMLFSGLGVGIRISPGGKLSQNNILFDTSAPHAGVMRVWWSSGSLLLYCPRGRGEDQDGLHFWGLGRTRTVSALDSARQEKLSPFPCRGSDPSFQGVIVSWFLTTQLNSGEMTEHNWVFGVPSFWGEESHHRLCVF